VHDCLIVRQKDQDVVIQMLSDAMQRHLSYLPSIDVTWFNDGGQKEVKIVFSDRGVISGGGNGCFDEEDDFDVLE
jgi:hypothetical protein